MVQRCRLMVCVLAAVVAGAMPWAQAAHAGTVKVMDKTRLRFADRTGVEPGSTVMSEVIKVTGKIAFPVAAIGGSGDPALRVNGGPWVKRAKSFKSGDTLQLRNQMMPLYFCDAGGKKLKATLCVGAYRGSAATIVNWNITSRPKKKVTVRNARGTVMLGNEIGRQLKCRPNLQITSPRIKVEGFAGIGQVHVFADDAAGKGTEWVRVVGGSWKKRWTLFSAGDQLEFRVTSPQPSKVRPVSIHLESRKLVWYVGSQGIDN